MKCLEVEISWSLGYNPPSVGVQRLIRSPYVVAKFNPELGPKVFRLRLWKLNFWSPQSWSSGKLDAFIFFVLACPGPSGDNMEGGSKKDYFRQMILLSKIDAKISQNYLNMYQDQIFNYIVFRTSGCFQYSYDFWDRRFVCLTFIEICMASPNWSFYYYSVFQKENEIKIPSKCI